MYDILPDTTINVLSFNCWGIPLPFMCKDYKRRMQAIKNKLFNANTPYDVICLQEIWSKNTFIDFRNEAKRNGVLPYSHYFYSGVLGSGICMFSKWPIDEVLFHKWQVNGYIHKITHADWYGGKGIGLCRLNIEGYKVDVYSCHTHAEYSEEAEYLVHRLVQAFDIAQFIRISSADADVTILAADLNSMPDELCFKIIVEHADMIDSYKEGFVEDSATYYSSRNSYQKPKTVGQRIDHILYKAGKNCKVECVSFSHPLESRVPNELFSYSDHEAILAKLNISRQTSSATNNQMNSFQKQNSVKLLDEALQFCNKAADKLHSEMSRFQYVLPMNLFCSVIILLILIVFDLCSPVIIIVLAFIAIFVLCLYFFIFIWKSIEYRGILCAAHGMETLQPRISNYDVHAL